MPWSPDRLRCLSVNARTPACLTLLALAQLGLACTGRQLLNSESSGEASGDSALDSMGGTSSGTTSAETNGEDSVGAVTGHLSAGEKGEEGGEGEEALTATESTAAVTTAITDGGESADSTDTGPVGCVDPDDPLAPRIAISGEIQGDAHWDCQRVYVLSGHVVVQGGTLTIAAGTTVQGTPDAVLVIEKDARLVTLGQLDSPVVFTSVLPSGQRSRGDWGGIVFLGTAAINGVGGVARVEGLAGDRSYGGSNPEHDCGALRYTRVEWAGFAISEGNELNGLSFYACGSQTEVDHVQAHMVKDDGFEFLGGGFDLDHLVVTGAADDAFDFDQGFSGHIQFVLVVHDPAVGNNGFEVSTNPELLVLKPITQPFIANATVLGSGPTGDRSTGMTFKQHGGGTIEASIFHAATGPGLLFVGDQVEAHAMSGVIELRNNLFYANGAPQFVHDEFSDWPVDEFAAWLVEGNNRGDLDPQLVSSVWPAINPTPGLGSPAEQRGTRSEGFEATDFAGAVAPGTLEPWTAAAWINYSPDHDEP